MMGSRSAGRRARTLLRMGGMLAGTGALVMAAACGDNDNNLVVPVTATVAVFKDSNFNFTTLHTFAMPDTVVHFAPVTGTPLDVSRQFDQVALQQVRSDLLSRGYVEITDPQTVRPDFVVLVGATATTNYNAFVGYSWFGAWGFYTGWGWYAPGFTTSWGVVYPWFGVVGVTAYDRGTLVVDLIPTLSVNPTARTIQSAWTGVATGLLNGSITANTVTAAINQMFALSPYLTASTTTADRR